MDFHGPEIEMASNLQGYISNLKDALHNAADWIDRIEYNLSKYRKGPRNLSKEDHIAITHILEELDTKETLRPTHKNDTNTPLLIPTCPNTPTHPEVTITMPSRRCTRPTPIE